MDWNAVGAVAELVGAMAVLVALVYRSSRFTKAFVAEIESAPYIEAAGFVGVDPPGEVLVARGLTA